MRSRKLLALLFCLITFPAIAGYMTLLGAGVGSIAPVVSWVSTTDPTFPSSSLTYSGPSLSTMFDSTGKLTFKPNNLLTYSNTFSNAAWSKLTGGTGTAAVVTANAGTDPLGGNTASRLQADRGAGGTSSDYSLLYQDITPGAHVKTLRTIWVKSNTGSSQSFLIYDGAGRNVGVTNTATTSWQQFALPDGVGTNAVSELIIGTRGGSGQYYTGGAQTLDLLLYAATNSAVTYETTPRAADQVITTSAAYYGPRIDYDPNTLAVKGLLIEEARTNLFINSGSLSSTSTVSAVKSTDGTLAPDGVTAMTKLTASAATASHELYNTAAMSVTSGGTYTGSIFVKKGNYRYVFVTAEVSNVIGFVAVFDLDNPTTATQTWGVGTGSYSSSRIDAVGGGIYRIQVTGAIGSGTTGYLVAGFTGAATGNSTASSEPSWTAAGTEYGYFFGAQLELGSFATSYIPTAAASVTRVADVFQFTEPALTALQGTAGTFIVESISESGSSPAAITNIVRGTNSIIYHDTTGKTGTTNGTTALLTAAAPTWNASLRNGLAWSASGRSLAYTGGAVATDANTVSNGGTLYLGSNNGSAVENGWYKSFGIWNQRLDDATFQTKLTVGGSYAANDNGIRYAFADNDNLPIHWRVAL